MHRKCVIIRSAKVSIDSITYFFRFICKPCKYWLHATLIPRFMSNIWTQLHLEHLVNAQSHPPCGIIFIVTVITLHVPCSDNLHIDGARWNNANTNYPANASSAQGQRLRRWPSTEPELSWRLLPRLAWLALFGCVSFWYVPRVGGSPLRGQFVIMVPVILPLIILHPRMPPLGDVPWDRHREVVGDFWWYLFPTTQGFNSINVYITYTVY